MSGPHNTELPGADFMMAALWDAAQPSGFAVPGYTILTELSRGGMGVVYHARQLRPEREVAVKVLLPHLAEDTEMLARFQLEARAMAALDHPGILPVYEVGEADGVPFFSMKLATGGSLAERIKQRALPPKEAASLIIQLARAVHHAHQHGVLHRDLKPANFLFLDSGRACVSDFGLAKLAVHDHGPLTRTESFFGTPHYMPPEVAAGSSGDATVAGDLYSMGAVFYECLTGRRPHAAKDNVAALLRSIADDPVSPPSQVKPALPRDLSIICMKSLERDPGDRYATLADFADDVERWLQGRPIRARPAGRLETAWRWARRHPLSAGLVAALLMVTLTGAALLAVSHGARGDALREARQKLHRSLIDQARYERLLGAPGHRDRALAHLRQAAEIARSPEIRDEAAALLARPDISPAAVDTVAAPQDWPPDKFADDRVTARRPSRGGDYALAFYASEGVRLWRRDNPNPLKEWIPASGRILAGDFTADGTRIAVAGTERGITIESLANSAPAEILAPPGPRVLFLAVDPAGRRLAAAREDGLEMLDLTEAGPPWHFPENGGATARCEPAWTADGMRVAAAAGDRREATILAAESGAVCVTAAVSGVPQHLAFHPDGTLLAVAADDGNVAICEAASGMTWTAFPGEMKSLAFSADGRELRASEGDGTVRAWRVSLPVALKEWPESPRSKADGPIHGMALSPDGSRLLTVTTGCLAVWSVPDERQTGYRLLEHQRIDATASAWWLSDGAILLQVPGGLERLTIDAAGKPGTPQRLPRFPGSTVLDVHPDGGWLVKMKDEDDRESCELWPGGDPSEARPAEMKEPAKTAVTRSADGQTASLTNGGDLEVQRRDGERMLLTQPLNPGVRALHFSPDGRRLIILTNQHRVFSWDLAGLSAALDALGL